MAPPIRYKTPPILPMLGRLLTLFFLLLLAVGISCCWYSLGISWIYDGVSDTFPIFDCPQFVVNTAVSGYADGPMCRVTLANNGITQEAVLDDYDCRMPPINSEDYIVCLVKAPCLSVCSLQNSDSFCPDSSLLWEPTPSDPGPDCEISLPNSDTFTTSCYYVNWTPFCESTYRVTPGAILAMRGLLGGTCIMVFIWLMAEITLWVADKNLAKDSAEGKSRQSSLLREYRARLSQELDRAWAVEAHNNRSYHGGVIAGTVSDVSRESSYEWGGDNNRKRSPIDSRDPRKRLSSIQWKRKVDTWKNLTGKKSRLFRTRVFARTLFLTGFFVLVLICAMYVIISVSPHQIPANADIFSVLDGTARILPLYTWLDGLIFMDIVLDFGLFLVATAAVSWPTSGIYATHIKEKLSRVVDAAGVRGVTNHTQAHNTHLPDSTDLSDTDHDEGNTITTDNTQEFDDGNVSIVSVLNQTMTIECCLLIACHESCLTQEKELSFVNTLQSALRVFPPDHIFVCDNGSSITPVDITQSVTASVHPDIHYLYIPEGNKTISFYWTNRYWIPFLESAGKIPKFKYAVIIDDDVPLPPDLHIPFSRLQSDVNIKAVHYPITATCFDNPSKPPLLVKCQDIEYKLAAVHKYFQSTIGRVISCHGAIALWERESLHEVLLQHDCVFNGEDMYMGISLLRKRDKSVIISCPQSIVPTFAPTTWSMLFRQRVKSWEVTSHKKTFTFLIELINPISWFHIKSVALKPYFLQELLSIVLDWVRIFLLISLAFRDYMALALMTVIFSLLMYIQVLVFQFVYLRRRKDLRVTVGGILLFPLYRLSSLLFRVCALCQNILVYSHYRKGVRIQDREDEVKDMPPCPPHHRPNWFTVWQPNNST